MKETHTPELEKFYGRVRSGEDITMVDNSFENESFDDVAHGIVDIVDAPFLP